MDGIERVDELVSRLKAASWKERDALKEELFALCQQLDHPGALEHLEGLRKGLPLEVRWEVEEVIERLTPVPEPEPEPEPEAPPEEEEPPADGRLRMSDLKEVYSDPRGLALFTDKSGKRWFASQPDQYTGQPQMFELPPAEVERVKLQLKGSPYWRIGSGIIT